MKQGVAYLSTPIVSEILALVKNVMYQPEFSLLSAPTYKIIEQNNGKVPPISGVCLPGYNLLSVNSVDFLDDIYINKNALNTKNDDAKMFCWLAPKNIVFMDTLHQEYAATRKELASAFFKSRLQTITTIIREETVSMIEEFQSRGDFEEDILTFWTKIQSQIFTAVAVGRGNTNVDCAYETSDGKVEMKKLHEVIGFLIEDAIERRTHFLFAMLPELLQLEVPITSVCRRFRRNVDSVRNAFNKIIENRKAGKAQSTYGDKDLLSILL